MTWQARALWFFGCKPNFMLVLVSSRAPHASAGSSTAQGPGPGSSPDREQDALWPGPQSLPWGAVGPPWVLWSVLLQTPLRCESVVCPWRGAIPSLCDCAVTASMQPSMAVGALRIGDRGRDQDRPVCVCAQQRSGCAHVCARGTMNAT